MTFEELVLQFGEISYDAYELAKQSWQASREAAIDECADECELIVMFPGDKQESYKHSGVSAAADAIRALKDK